MTDRNQLPEPGDADDFELRIGDYYFTVSGIKVRIVDIFIKGAEVYVVASHGELTVYDLTKEIKELREWKSLRR